MSVASPSTDEAAAGTQAPLLEVSGLSISRRGRHGWVNLVDGAVRSP